MNSDAPKTLKESFSVLKDPRDESKRWHKLIDIVILAIAAVICGADDLTGIEAFGKAKVEWFKRLKAGWDDRYLGNLLFSQPNQ